MGRFVKGEVVTVSFPFTDGAGTKKRPALVVSVLPVYGDLILCMITSQPGKDSDAIPLVASDFATGALPKPSNVRPNRLFTVSEKRVQGSAGHLAPAKLGEVVDKLVEIVRR
jgi:mRNA interferase MazF